MEEGGGLFPHLVLGLWPLVTIALFFTMKPDRAALVAIFTGLMFLPEITNFRIPSTPPLSKQNIPYLSVLLGYTLTRPGRVWKLPKEKWVVLMMLLLVVDGIGNGLTNQDPLIYGTWRKTFVQGLGIKDGMFFAAESIFQIGVPFFLGGVIVRDAKDLRHLLELMIKFALVYSFCALIEVRLSPQMHGWVYGFAQHSFAQTIRYGGYRPMVFMGHGLAVGLFFSVSVMIAAGLPRGHRIWGLTPRTIFIILAVILVLCKSTGAIIYALMVVPILLFGSPRLAQRIATVVAVIVLLYPSMRESGAFPTAQVLSASEALAGADREDSLAFRFRNEEELVKKARQRPWFGWGEYGRNLVYNEMGKATSVTDGAWIIAFSVGGFAGFLGWFVLLVLPIFLAGRRLKRIPISERPLVASLSLIVSMTALDLLPNGLFSNYPYLLSGALLSVSKALTLAQPAPMPDAIGAAAPPMRAHYGAAG
jgi:hypothetical protein